MISRRCFLTRAVGLSAAALVPTLLVTEKTGAPNVLVAAFEHDDHLDALRWAHNFNASSEIDGGYTIEVPMGGMARAIIRPLPVAA